MENRKPKQKQKQVWKKHFGGLFDKETEINKINKEKDEKEEITAK